MVTEYPLEAWCGIAFDQQHLRLAALHADLVRGVDGAVEGGFLADEDLECDPVQSDGPFQTAAKNMEIVPGLCHRSVLSHIFDRQAGESPKVPTSMFLKLFD